MQRGISPAIAVILRLWVQVTIAVYVGAWLRRLTRCSRWCPAELLLSAGRAEMRWRDVACPVGLSPRWVGEHLIVLTVDDGRYRWQLPLFSCQLPPNDFRRLRSLAHLGGLGKGRNQSPRR